jgi:hypothetical protein
MDCAGGVLETDDEDHVEMEDAHRTEEDADMKHEAARLATFHNWPVVFIRSQLREPIRFTGARDQEEGYSQMKNPKLGVRDQDAGYSQMQNPK